MLRRGSPSGVQDVPLLKSVAPGDVPPLSSTSLRGEGAPWRSPQVSLRRSVLATTPQMSSTKFKQEA